MILISNTCINSIIYKDYYKKPYNNPFVNCFIGIKDFTQLVSEYETSMKDSWKMYIDWSIERRLINDDFKYTKMITGIYDDKIKIHYLHDTNRRYDIEKSRDANIRRHKRWINIRHKEMTIFVYTQHPLDTKQDIYNLFKIKLSDKCRLIVYCSYKLNILQQMLLPKNIFVIYIKPMKSPIYDSYDILRKECFIKITNSIKEYLTLNKIEYNT